MSEPQEDDYVVEAYPDFWWGEETYLGYGVKRKSGLFPPVGVSQSASEG